MPRVVHFEIHAGDPERAISFYQRVFGWAFQKWEGPMDYWVITTGPDEQRGINGMAHDRLGTRFHQFMIFIQARVDAKLFSQMRNRSPGQHYGNKAEYGRSREAQNPWRTVRRQAARKGEEDGSYLQQQPG